MLIVDGHLEVAVCLASCPGVRVIRRIAIEQRGGAVELADHAKGGTVENLHPTQALM